MTWKLMARVLEDPRLRPGPRLALLALAYHHNGETGQCFPGMRTIMRETGMSERALLRALKNLREGKYFDVEKGRSRFRTNLYTMRPERWPTPTKPTRQKQQFKPAISDGSDLPAMQQNHKEEQEKKKQEEKTCEKSQANYKIQKKYKAGKEEEKDKNGNKENKKKNKSEEQLNLVSSISVLPEKLEQLPPVPEKANKLSLLWREHTAALDVSYCPTAKDGKMLRQAADKIGYQNALSVIPYVLSHWNEFADHASEKGVAYTLPKIPSVPFFLKFASVALDYVALEKEKQDRHRQIEEIDAQIQQTQVEMDRIESTLSATIEKPLSPTKKMKIMEVSKVRVQQWEKMFGPITSAYECLDHGGQVTLARFSSSPEIMLSKTGPDEIEAFKKELAAAHRQLLIMRLKKNAAYAKFADSLDTLNKQKKVLDYA